MFHAKQMVHFSLREVFGIVFGFLFIFKCVEMLAMPFRLTFNTKQITLTQYVLTNEMCCRFAMQCRPCSSTSLQLNPMKWFCAVSNDSLQMQCGGDVFREYFIESFQVEFICNEITKLKFHCRMQFKWIKTRNFRRIQFHIEYFTIFGGSELTLLKSQSKWKICTHRWIVMFGLGNAETIVSTAGNNKQFITASV